VTAPHAGQIKRPPGEGAAAEIKKTLLHAAVFTCYSQSISRRAPAVVHVSCAAAAAASE